MSELVLTFPLQAEISITQKEILLQAVSSFLDQWKAHGTPLTSAVSIEFDRFIVIKVDEVVAQASGCSKDKLYHFIENECQNLGLNLAPGHLFFVRNGEKIEALSKKELQESLKNQRIAADNEAFPTWITNGVEWKDKWGQPISTVLPGLMLPA